MIRPVITNFASGELDPRLEGRVDLSMYSGSAKELTNFFPSRLGGAFKRGGLQYKINTPSQSYACRLIPWSINGTTQILIALYDRAIKFIDVSGGIDPVYLTRAGDGADVTITSLDSTGSILPYSTADLAGVNYAQNGSQITIVHKNYPPFYIDVNNIDIVQHRISFSYGIHILFSNIAYNTAGSVEDDGVEINSEDVSDALRELNDSVDHTCDATSFIYIGGVKHTITKVNVTQVHNTSHFDLYNSSRSSLVLSMTYPSSSTYANALTWPVKHHSWEIWDMNTYDYLSDNTVSISPNATYSAIFESILANFGPGHWFKVAATPSVPPAVANHNGRLELSSSYVLQGILYNNPASFSVVITYDTGSLTLNTAGVSVRCSITIGGRQYISGAKTTGGKVFDALAPWMKRDQEYQCDQSMAINGVVPATARKQLSGGEETIVFTGFPITTANPTGVLTIDRDSSGIMGQAGIILTPFYRVGDHPSVVCYHQGRLVLAGNGNNIYVSKSNDHSNFSYFEDIEFQNTSLKPSDEWIDPLVPETRTDLDKTQQVGAAQGMRLEIATDENEDIHWMLSVGDLVIGTSTTEWVIPAAVTAMNPQAIQTSRNGSSSLQAKFVGKSIVFASPTYRGVISYTPGSTQVEPSISEHAASMFTSNIIAFDFRQSPVQEMYFVLANGLALRLLMSGDVPQWSRLTPAGWNSSGTGTMIEGIAIIASSDEDAVYFTVKRIINGATVRYIERLVTTKDDTFANRCHLDCSSYVAAVAGGTVTIARFVSCTVNVVFRLAGVEYRGTAATNGSGVFTQYTDSVTGLATNVSTMNGAEAWVGFAYSSRLETFRIDTTDTEGLEKGGGRMHVRVYKSGQFKVMRGYDLTDPGYVAPIPVDATTGLMVYPYTGAVPVEHDAPELVDQSVVIQSDDDQSVNILVLAPSYSVAVQP
jgi:hypothetical protein